jgi:hypothetical protein
VHHGDRQRCRSPFPYALSPGRSRPDAASSVTLRDDHGPRTIRRPVAAPCGGAAPARCGAGRRHDRRRDDRRDRCAGAWPGGRCGQAATEAEAQEAQEEEAALWWAVLRQRSAMLSRDHAGPARVLHRGRRRLLHVRRGRRRLSGRVAHLLSADDAGPRRPLRRQRCDVLPVGERRLPVPAGVRLLRDERRLCPR